MPDGDDEKIQLGSLVAAKWAYDSREQVLEVYRGWNTVELYILADAFAADLRRNHRTHNATGVRFCIGRIAVIAEVLEERGFDLVGDEVNS